MTQPAEAGTLPVPETERLARLRLARAKGIGAATFTKLMGLYGTAEQAIEALPARARLAGRTPPAIPTTSQMEDETAWLARRGACHLLRSDAAYPRLLATIPNAPVLLYARGDTALLSAPSLAIVGARQASSPALDLTEHFATGLAEAGLTIISGLARGIDGAAHRGALPFGRTIAALPGGLDVTYPPEHATLQEEIARHGCLLTEYPPGTSANARHFPRRNHLIAGLSQGCLLVEAARRSGTLITARLALTYQRLLFAVPGFPKDPRSGGGNDLLRQNRARLAEDVSDILAALADIPPADHNPAPWSRPAQHQLPLFTPSTVQAAPRTPPATSLRASRASTTPSPIQARSDSAPPPHPFSHHPDGRTTAPASTARPPRPPCRAATAEDPPPHTGTPGKTRGKTAGNTKRDSAAEKEKNILSLLAHTPCTVDEIASRCQLSISVVAAILIELEIGGVIQRHGDGRITTL